MSFPTPRPALSTASPGQFSSDPAVVAAGLCYQDGPHFQTPSHNGRGRNCAAAGDASGCLHTAFLSRRTTYLGIRQRSMV